MAQNCPNTGFTSGHYGNVKCGICFRLHCQDCGYSIDDANECWTGNDTYPACRGNTYRKTVAR